VGVTPNKGEIIMAKQPTHRAYLVPENDPDTTKKPFWTAVGAVWPHDNGAGGFNLVLPPGLSVSGRIVCVPISAKDEA
jgi:hypothetical protein